MADRHVATKTKNIGSVAIISRITSDHSETSLQSREMNSLVFGFMDLFSIKKPWLDFAGGFVLNENALRGFKVLMHRIGGVEKCKRTYA